MSSPFAIAGLTATLQHVLGNGLADHGVTAAVGGMLDVKALAPDLVVPNGNLGNPTLNIFLYQVTPNTGWRNVDLASRNSSGNRSNNPPMALDIHYVLSAYADDDLQAEMILGGAMHLLHEMPGLDRVRINAALMPLAVNLRECGLADQVENIKIVPEPLNSEEMSKLWSAIQSNYRPSVAYQATVVLIQEERPKRSALPVLMRGSQDTGPAVQPHLIPPVPTLLSIEYPDGQLGARAGATITIHGHSLEGNNVEAIFLHGRLDEPLQTVAVAPAAVSARQISLQIPSIPANWAAGIYAMELRLERPGESDARVSNQLPFVLAPTLTLPPNPPGSISRAGTEVTVLVGCNPEVRPSQPASLILGQHEVFANPLSAQTDQLTFVFDGIDAGNYSVRLRVDGAESWLVDKTATPPVFDPSQTIDVPL